MRNFGGFGYGHMLGLSDGQVGGSHTEAVDGVSDVGSLLDQTVSVDIGVFPTGYSIESSSLEKFKQFDYKRNNFKSI